MISDLFMLTIMLGMMVFSFTRPHIALALAVWVNIVNPQNLSFSFLAGKPLSLVTSAFFFCILIINLKKVRVPKSPLYHVLMLGFMVWVTIATYQAEYQNVAWIKYDFTIKTLIFAYFIPFVLTKREHVETFLWVCALSFGLFLFMGGLKTALGGGGYGVNLIGVGYFLYSEGSTLATLAVSLMPIFICLKDKSIFTEEKPVFKYVLLGFLLCCVLTVIGTQARTGLVVLAFFTLLMLVKYKVNIKVYGALAIAGTIIILVAPSSWFERMQSIEEGTTTEKSAVGRLVVWRWTLDYVKDRPFLGGGFYSYNANAGILHHYQGPNEVPIIQKGGKAFHNIFFEVLGETGYVGLLFFCGIIFHTLLVNRGIKKRYKGKAGEWRGTFAECLNHSTMLYCLGGLFVGIAFYPWLYYLYTATIALNNVEDV